MEKSVIPFADMTLQEKLALTESIFIKYPMFERIINKIDYCHQFSKIAAEPKCLFVTGLSGTGKTTICEHYESAHPSYEDKEGSIVPVLFASLSSAATKKSIASDILESIGDPTYDKGTANNMTKRIKTLVNECRVELIIIDEFQHLIDSDSDTVLMNSANWIKDLINKIKIPIILVGMPWSDRILNANSQMRRRFSASNHLKPFPWKEGEKDSSFHDFLRLVESKLPLEKKSQLYQYELAFRIYCATSGIVGQIMKLLRRATAIALEAQKERITQEILEIAYDAEMAGEEMKCKNPFARNLNEISLPENPEVVETRHFQGTMKRARKVRASDVLCA